MGERSTVSVPLKLALRRARYQLVPIITMLVSTALAGWLWMRHAHTATASGEVSAVRVSIESRVEGVLEELPQPIRLFDTVRNGQVIARVDLSVLDKQVQRMRAELDRMRATTQPSQPSDPLLAEREAQIAELEAKLNARDIKSPVNGSIKAIHRRPGQTARHTKPIMVIASEEAQCIIGYLREDQPLRPVPGMKVIIRTRGGVSPRRSFDSYVSSVAPQIEAMPKRHLRNPAVAEWALPVQIAIPTDADLKPGEMVDLIFQPKAD